MKEKKVGPLIKCIHNLHQARINANLERMHLTSTQMHVLIYLFRADKSGKRVYSKDIESFYNLTNPTVSGIVNRLETKGLVKRVVNEEDARFKYIQVTEKAKELDVELRSFFDETEDKLLSGFQEEEKEQLISYLERMIENSKKEDF